MTLCQVCGKGYPPTLLFNLKGNVPGGAKVTCLECVGRLEEREACAALADAAYESLKDEDEAGAVSTIAVEMQMLARAIRARK